MVVSNINIKQFALLFGIMFFSVFSFAQVLTTNPCAEPATSELTVDDPCVATTTAGFTNLFDPGSCNSGLFDDGWAWYIGTGAANTITYTPDPGFDAVIHLFEVPDPAACSVIELGCSDTGGAGVTETIVGGGTLGTLYYIRIQLYGSNTTMTGCIGVVANPATCSDFIQNGTETGVDCGGSCPYACPPPTTGSYTGGADPCFAPLNTTVDIVDCSLIGTAGFNSTTGDINFDGSVKINDPVPTPACGVGGGTPYGTWVQYDPLVGVTAATLNVVNATGTSDVNIAFYQGTCGSLTQLGCQLLLESVPPNMYLQPVNVSGINDAQPLWAYVYSTKAFSFTGTLLGTAAVASNDDCGSAIAATGPACNAGATPSTFIPPSNYSAGICTGGTWYSNENTVYYSFTPTTTTATLEIDNILCDDGSAGGTSQFGVWENCADLTNNPLLVGSGFLGCVVGTAPLSLSGLTIGATYYIVVDGNAGSVCSWDFSSTGGIILPIKLIDFTAELVEDKVELEWTTVTEINNDYFTVEKSKDGFVYEEIGIVEGAGNSNTMLKYNLLDRHPLNGISYYRLKQTDYDGSSWYSEVLAVKIESGFEDAQIYPNPVKEHGVLHFYSKDEREIDLKIFDVTGREVFSETILPSKGDNKFVFDINSFKSGMYFVHLNNEKDKKNLKFIKE